MQYKCLIFDHDDTVVNSTATIHHPCFVDYLSEFRPGMTISLEDYFIKNFDPGFIQMCKQDFMLSDADLDIEVEYWKKYVSEHIPAAYDGIRDIMRRHKEQGGIIAVVSHSMKDNIIRDYEYNRLPEPDIIYGWEQPPERRKPSVWPVEQILDITGFERNDLLMIDDLKPGYDMAMGAEIDFAAAGWAYDVPQIENFMRNNCTNYFKNVEQLAQFLSAD